MKNTILSAATAAMLIPAAAFASTVKITVTGEVLDVYEPFVQPGVFEPGVGYTATYRVNTTLGSGVLNSYAVEQFDIAYDTGLGESYFPVQPAPGDFRITGIWIMRNDLGGNDTFGGLTRDPGGAQYIFLASQTGGTIFSSTSIDELFKAQSVNFGAFGRDDLPRELIVSTFDGETSIYGTCTTGDLPCRSTLSLDEYSIVAVPVPASAMLLFSAFGGLFVMRRRKQA